MINRPEFVKALQDFVAEYKKKNKTQFSEVENCDRKTPIKIPGDYDT